MRSLGALIAIVLTPALPSLAAQGEPQRITVTSPVLKEGQPIPKDYTADGKNVSPPIMWSNLPAATKELVATYERTVPQE